MDVCQPGDNIGRDTNFQRTPKGHLGLDATGCLSDIVGCVFMKCHKTASVLAPMSSRNLNGIRTVGRPLPRCGWFLFGIAHLVALVMLTTAMTPSVLARDARGGIIGTDDRRVVESLKPPWNAVGRINIAGYRKTRHCSGTLIAPNLVLTAAHCLIKRRTGKPEPVGNIHFLAGLRRGKYVAHRKAACVHFLDGRTKTTFGPTIRAEQDVAVIVTKSEMPVPPTPIQQAVPTDANTLLVHAGHPRDRPQILNAHTNCRLLENAGTLWFTDCDTNPGESGGPVFLKTGDTLELAAVMIGFIRGKQSVAVPASAWQSLVQKQKCQ